MTPFERLVRAVELDVTGEEGNPPERYELALRNARLYTEAVLRSLHRVQVVRDVAVEAAEQEFEAGWAARGRDYQPDPRETVDRILDALAQVVVPPIGAKR